jgi:hypothetical protein
MSDLSVASRLKVERWVSADEPFVMALRNVLALALA